jgi:hypothetical protein
MEENEIGVNESEVAEQTEETPEVEETTETPAEEVTEAEPELDRNAIYADARRKAEAEARHKYASIDAQYAERFKDYTNPLTGQPIKGAKDYFDAIAAQEQLATQRKLIDKGLDPNIIEEAVNNSPAIKAANLIIEEQRKKEIKDYLDKQVREISKIDPSIKTVNDIENSERYPEVQRYVDQNRLSVVDAYKLVYADKLTTKKTEAAKQAAINNAKSQQHLKSTDGGATADGLVNIPEKDLAKWQEFYPEKSSKELRELYNKYLHKD